MVRRRCSVSNGSDRILKIPAGLEQEAHSVFRLLSLGIPVVLVSASFSGALEGAQRFDLLNAVRIPASIGMYLLPMLGAMAGLKLPTLVLLIMAIRLSAFLAFVSLTLKIFPSIKVFPRQLNMITKMFTFGGWVTVSNIVGPYILTAF
jgi:hypothetical protein